MIGPFFGVPWSQNVTECIKYIAPKPCEPRVFESLQFLNSDQSYGTQQWRGSVQERGLSTRGPMTELKLRVRMARKAAARMLERAPIAMVKSTSEFLQNFHDELRAEGLDPQEMKVELELQKVRQGCAAAAMNVYANVSRALTLYPSSDEYCQVCKPDNMRHLCEHGAPS
jgi:hypothetical protein